jgi:hypothetical protein
VGVGENAGKDLKMKNLLLLGVAVLAAAPAFAQSPSIQADIPFAFTVSDQTLAAGAYRFDIDLFQRVVRIKEANGNRVWMAPVFPGGSDRAAANLHRGLLRFDRHGDRYLLNGVWAAGSTRGTAVRPSRLPRELAKSSGSRFVQGTR